jgi:iron(III) transport system permease protein
MGAAVALVAALGLLPLVYLVWEVFAGPDGPTLEAFRDAYAVEGVLALGWTSLAFAAGSAALAMGVGTLQALLVVRTDVPARRLIAAGALVPLFLPGVLYTIAWILLASPRIGMLNRVLPGTVDVFGLGGMILAEGLHLAPLVFLMTAAAFAAQDGGLEEAAVVAGARTRAVLRRVTIPLVAPALAAAALLCAVRALEAFEVPALLGAPSGTWVFTSRIWQALGRFPADLPAAGAASLSLLVLTGAGAFAVARVGRRGRAFEVVGGSSRRPVRLDLGRWRRPGLAAGLGTVVVGALLPLAALVYASTQPFYAPPSARAWERLTLSPYEEAFAGASLESLTTSFALAAVAATAITGLMAVIAWVVARTRLPGRTAIDVLASLPLAIPGLVVGVALLALSTRVSVLYGTVWILLAAYLTRFMPYGIRSATAALRRVRGELEDAARVSGATWWASFRRVVLPLIAPGLAAGWLYVYVLAIRELSSVLVLLPPQTELVAVRIFGEYQHGQLSELSALGLTVAALLGLLTAAAWRLTPAGVR